MVPNFLIAGGVASGTSFLSATLSHHPDIYLPKIQRPEPNFFHYSWKFKRGIDWYISKWFHEVDGQQAVGERSSLLLSSKGAPEKIKRSFPDIKLIFCLRNPIERAWGNYRFTVLEGLEPLSFESAVDMEPERIKNAKDKWSEVQPHAYITRGYYFQNLSEYVKLFGKENILVLKSEDLGKFPHENLKKVCDFIGVDPTVELPLPPNYSSPSVKDRQLQVELRDYFGDRFSKFIEYIRKEKDISAFVESDEDRENLEKLKRNIENRKDPLPDSMRKRLRSIFSSDIAALRSLVDFNVDDWT